MDDILVTLTNSQRLTNKDESTDALVCRWTHASMHMHRRIRTFIPICSQPVLLPLPFQVLP